MSNILQKLSFCKKLIRLQIWKAAGKQNGVATSFLHTAKKTARGVCALVPKGFDGEVIWLKSDNDGRMIFLEISQNFATLHVLGIYAPTQSNEREQESFFDWLSSEIRELDDALPVIICGDLNVHLTAADTNNIRFHETRACKVLRDLMKAMDLLDGWRELNPDKKRFSWRRCQPLQQSRIDYFLLSEVLFTSQKVVKMDIDPGVRSDHSVIVMEIFVKGGRRGPRLWRFNTTFLEDKDIADRIRLGVESAKAFEGEYSCVTDPGVL